MPGLYKIGVVTRRTGLSAATLRLWEEQYGLLAPERSQGGTRLYSESDIERALLIRTLTQERSYTLEAIARLIDHNELSALSKVGDSTGNGYLWEAANREYIEEGRRVAALHPLLRQLTRARSGRNAAVALVEGARAMTGAHAASLGLYHRETHTMSFVVTVVGGHVHQLARPPLAISRVPLAWQQAIAAREAYADPDLLRVDLPEDISARASADATRSFHAEPLTIGSELVGFLVIGSPQPGGMSREAIALAERLAVPAGPAIYYFASGL